MKILVTGATGFFGRAIVERLRREGHNVDGAARRPDGRVAGIALDITVPAQCQRVIAAGAYDGIVHAAALAHVRPGALDTAACLAVNGEGAANIVAAAAACTVPRYVLVSSVMVYGDHSIPAGLTEEAPRLSRGVYGMAKIHAEDATLAASGPMSRTVLRMSSMYAPDWVRNIRKRVVVPGLAGALYFALDARSPRYSLCSRRTGVEVVCRALEGRLRAGIYNVADNYVYSQHEIRQALACVAGRRPVLPVPKVLPRVVLQLAETLLRDAAALESARSRYWKFCERNVYSCALLAAAGVPLPADLLALTATCAKSMSAGRAQS